MYDRCCLFNSWLVVVSLHEITMWLRWRNHCYISQVTFVNLLKQHWILNERKAYNIFFGLHFKTYIIRFISTHRMFKPCFTKPKSKIFPYTYSVHTKTSYFTMRSIVFEYLSVFKTCVCALKHNWQSHNWSLCWSIKKQ